MQGANMEDTCRKKAPPSKETFVEGHPMTSGPGINSLMVQMHAGGGWAVGSSLPRWRWGSIEKGAKTRGGQMQAWPSRSRLLSNAHALGHGVGPRSSEGENMTMGRPFLAWEARGEV